MKLFSLCSQNSKNVIMILFYCYWRAKSKKISEKCFDTQGCQGNLSLICVTRLDVIVFASIFSCNEHLAYLIYFQRDQLSGMKDEINANIFIRFVCRSTPKFILSSFWLKQPYNKIGMENKDKDLFCFFH